MFQIIDSRGSGKTSRLMLLAKENNGVFVCANPDAMKVKARAYGLTGFDIISYYDLVSKKHEYDKKPIFIDELDMFVARTLTKDVKGYSLTIGD
jgi:hypothetical protein